MTRRISSVLLTLLFMPLMGCPKHRRTYPPPHPKSLLAALEKQDKEVRTFRGQAKADQFTKKGRVKLKVYILARRDGKLRFQAVSPVDTPLVTLVSDGKQFLSIDHKANRVYRGAATPCNVSRVVQLRMTGQEVARALGGGAPVIQHDKLSLTWDKDEGAELLRLEDTKTGTVQRIWVKKDGSRWRVLRARVCNRAGKVVVDLRFERYRRVGGRQMPRVVKFEQPPRSDVIIRYRTQDLNVAIPDDAFKLEAPAGLPVRRLECRE